MTREINLGWMLVAALGFCALLLGVFLALREDPAEKPYLHVMGASFIFNYRVSDVYMGFTAVPMKSIPVGTILEASFENPAAEDPFIVEERISVADRRISLRSPPLHGVEAEKPYHIGLRLLERQSRDEIWRHDLEITAGISDSVVPEAPLTFGPGYHRPPGTTSSQ